jgi:nuclear mRNA export protein SAC3
MANGFMPTFNTPTNTTYTPTPSLNATPTSSSALAEKMDKLLEKEGINRPIWPTSTPGDPKQKGAVEAFWQTSKVYRGKVRATLIRAGLLDDPDKPKKLSEAIDFKGTCEDMCPEFEKITRIIEHDVQGPEKEVAPDGSLWPSPQKMVKALARSAAGQDAPLPMDVRSPAALRRTLDYLMHTVLGDDGNLPSVHGFLWDRTRAIRRDFVFQSSMNPSELGDQVYCLERITRFHVIALHRMSRDDVVAEDFSEQQEIEQLGKALLSLIHAYEDCNAQNINCENEAEFRAYYVLFNSHNTGILETVQDWGWRFWGESDQIRIAVSLVEALQNTWDSRGPLKPHSATDIAQNAYSRFFSIVEDMQVSYTMACFAEIHFNTVRKSALKTILASYRKQRDQTKDWTLAKLNAYLWFDDEEDIISFGESYGLQFDEIDDEVYLSFELGDAISDPFPPLKQRHSYSLVERKRGDNSLPAVIDKTVSEREDSEKHAGFDEPSSWNTNGQGEGELELFVKDNNRENGVGAGVFLSESMPVNRDDKQPKEQLLALIQDAHTDSTTEQKAFPKPASSSLFDHIAAPPKQFGIDFFTHKVAEKPSLDQRGTSEPLASAFTKPPAKSPPFTLTSTLAPSSGTTISTPPSSFVPQTPIRPSTESPKTSLSLGSYTVSTGPVPGVGAKPQFSFGDYAVTSPNEVAAISIAQPNEAPFGRPTRDQDITSPTKTSQLPYSESSSSAAPATTFEPLSSSPQIQAETTKLTSAPQISSLLLSHDHKLSHASPFSTPQTPTFTNRKEKFSKFCDWFATGEHGLVDQFAAFSVEQILKNATRIYMNAEAERRTKEADALARREADQFRYRALATRYGRMWRDAAHRKWLRRRGREARKARQEMAENLRASKTAQSANIVEDFKASTNARRNSLESLLDATGVLNGVHDSNEKIRAIVQNEMKKVGPGHLRRRSERSTNSPSSSTSNIKRGKSDNPLRRSLMSDPSYLNGGSRIHLMSHYGSQDEERRHVSGVQTDYFRLKARGITTLPNGTPLASSVAHTTLHKKRSFEYSRPITPELSGQLTIPRSAPTNNIHRGIPRGTAEREDDIQALKARAKAIIADEERSRRKEKKRSLDEGEEAELFARAKRIREQMDEGAQWFRSEIERSRSIS